MSARIDDGLTKNQRYYRKHLAGTGRVSQQVREWRAANPERTREVARTYYARNREKLLAYKAAHVPAKTDAMREYDRLSKSRRRAAADVPDALTREQWRDICAQFDYRCAYCGSAPDTLCVEHVVPISKGGLHTAGNVVPACRPCNSSKRDRTWPVHRPTTGTEAKDSLGT